MKTRQGPHIVVIGSLNMDVVVEAERPPQMGETILGDCVHFLPGGKGANQAVALARLGASVTMIGTVGDDAFGKELLESLKGSGINTDSIKITSETSTGTAHILLSQGDNQIIVVPAANSYCLPADIEHHEEVIAQADIILLQLEIPLETVEYAVKTAKRHGKTVILNPAPVRNLPDELLRQVDYLTPNQTELMMLTGSRSDNPELAEARMKMLLKQGVGHIVTTLGAEGSIFMDQQERPGKVKGYRVKVVDTTGAGDSFNAGLSYALAKGLTLEESVEFAIKVSAMTVTKLGAQSGMPTMEEVLAFDHQNYARG